MEILTRVVDGTALWLAGYPDFRENFPRDAIVSFLLTENTALLKDQIQFCTSHLPLEANPSDGTEPNKDFHQYPSVIINGLSTERNACDTTALVIIACEFYKEKTGDEEFIEGQKKSLIRRVSYICSHVNEQGLFVEDPKFSGATKFALKVTYWKDSALIDRENGEPLYPVVYTLAHFQNTRAVRSAARLLGSNKLNLLADKMLKAALANLWDKELGTFYIAKDKKGPIRGVSSDPLHALFYLSPGDIPQDYLNNIVESSRVLETPIGYLTLDPKLSERVSDDNHSKTLWLFEQAVIHNGAVKFGLEHVQQVSKRIVPTLQDTNAEKFTFGDGSYYKAGNDIQLWTIAAKQYFRNLRNEPILN